MPCEKLIFKCFRKPKKTSCQNKTWCDDSFVIALFKNTFYIWVGALDFWEGHGKIGPNAENARSPRASARIFPVSPWHIKTPHFTPFLTNFTSLQSQKAPRKWKKKVFLDKFLNSSLIFDPLPILGISSKFYCTPLTGHHWSWISQHFILKTYAYPKLWRKNLWGVGSSPPPHGIRRVKRGACRIYPPDKAITSILKRLMIN